MNGYEVVINQLRKAGSAATSAGEQAAQIDLAGAISGVPTGLIGSRSADAAIRLGIEWARTITGWGREACALGDGMSSSADLYATNEAAAEESLRTQHHGSWWVL